MRIGTKGSQHRWRTTCPRTVDDCEGSSRECSALFGLGEVARETEDRPPENSEETMRVRFGQRFSFWSHLNNLHCQVAPEISGGGWLKLNMQSGNAP